MFAVLLILLVAFLPETLYPRGSMIELGAGALAQEKVDINTITLKRTRSLPFLVSILHQSKLTFLEFSSCSWSLSSETMAYPGSICPDVVLSNHRYCSCRILLPLILVVTIAPHHVPCCISRFRSRYSRSIDDWTNTWNNVVRNLF